MSKYIKRVNWPWIEIETSYENSPTITVNMNEVAAVWPFPNFQYHAGILLKNGVWLDDMFSREILMELQEIIMDKPAVINQPIEVVADDVIDMLHENRSLYEWLNEEGQV